LISPFMRLRLLRASGLGLALRAKCSSKFPRSG
jgi:hypothetical protein